VHVIHQVGCDEVAQHRHTTTNPDVEIPRSLLGHRQDLGRRPLDEVEGRAAFHLDRRPGVVGHHEDRRVERRHVTPPALPILVLPRPALGSEFIASHDLRADTRLVSPGQRILNAAIGATPHRRLEHPRMQTLSGMAEWRLEGLDVTGPEAVQGNGELVYSNFRHTYRP